MIAFLYAGQGSQSVGMGKDLYESYPSFREVMDNLSPYHKTLAFEGPMEELSKTENTQPCMVAFAAGITRLLFEEGIVPQMAAGLSLGEYSALCASGVFSAKQAIALAEFRGKEMAQAASGVDSKMAAVLQLPRKELADCCTEASALGVVCIANYNCPGQLVIGGEAAAVDKACELALEKGARRCLPLAVSGPFHTPLMKKAGDALYSRLQKEELGAMAFPVIFNATARPICEPQDIPGLLEIQVQRSVMFEDTMLYMKENGVDRVIEIGPGKVLSGFLKKTCPEITVYSVENIQTLAAAIAAIKGDK